MSEKDRLIGLLCTAGWNLYINDCNIGQIADHLIANNIALPPVSVGQTIYLIRRPTERPAWVDECKVDHVRIDYFKDGCKTISFGGYNYGATESYIGKTVFLTREEAEQALKERSESNG